MKEQINQAKKRRTNPYSQIANSILNDRELSLKAKGLYAFMYSKPDDWNFTASSMAAQLKESRKTILKMLQELRDLGIVEYQKSQNGTGKYILEDEMPPQTPKSQNDTLAQNSQSPKTTPCNIDTVQKWDCINNTDLINNIDLINKRRAGFKKEKIKG